MFERAFLVGTGRTRRAWTIPLGFAVQVLIAGGAVVAPLVFVDSPAPLRRASITPPFRRGNPNGGGTHKRTELVRIPEELRDRNTFYAPSGEVARNAGGDDAVRQAFLEGPPCVGACVEGHRGVPDGIVDGLPLPPEQRVTPPAPEARHAQQSASAAANPPRIKVGGLVQEGRLIHRALPVYPVLAVRTRVTGVVRLHAIIGTDGRIHELRAVSGHPMLVPAALDAVRQWLYQPTQLNGTPVEVETEISVTFNLTS